MARKQYNIIVFRMISNIFEVYIFEGILRICFRDLFEKQR